MWKVAGEGGANTKRSESAELSLSLRHSLQMEDISCPTVSCEMAERQQGLSGYYLCIHVGCQERNEAVMSSMPLEC